jgi:hypothetical protein
MLDVGFDPSVFYIKINTSYKLCFSTRKIAYKIKRETFFSTTSIILEGRLLSSFTSREELTKATKVA